MSTNEMLCALTPKGDKAMVNRAVSMRFALVFIFCGVLFCHYKVTKNY